ncbi:MAG: ABC transporter ATP-binding protein [Candidatus Pacebacteria bacterium]|nr:ABC transporter ATP-binding protein [Candidatus Paceibacterota bacterium]
MKKKLTKDDYLNGLRTIFSYLTTHKKRLQILIWISLVLSVSNPLVPFLTGKLLDSIISSAQFNIWGLSVLAVYVWLAAWLITQFITYSLEQLRSTHTGTLGNTLYGEYIVKGYNYLLNLPLSFHKKKKIGAVLNNITRSANVLEDIANRVIINLAPQFISILVAVFITLTIEPKIALVMFIGVAVYVVVLILTVDASTLIQRKIQKGWVKAWRGGYDSIDNVVAVKQMSTEEYEQKKNWRNFIFGAIKYNIEMTMLMRKIGWYQKLIILATQTIIFILAINFVRGGQMTIGQIITLTSYTGMLFAPFITLGDYWRTIQNGFISLKDSEKIFNTEAEKYIPDDEVKLKDIAGRVTFKNTSFSYEGNNPVLSNINFEVQPGEVVALVGKSGEGKSTLIDLISGYHFAKKGRVEIDGVDVKRINLHFLRRNIGVVPQEVVLFSDTIKTNIAYGNLAASDKDIAAAAHKAHALEFIEKFPKKWKQVVGERGVKLSVGQKQRVAIARAILRNPKILILDEPTSALDAESESFITKALEELMKGRTTFIIAHRLSTVRRADKILVFKDGQIAEVGKHDELITRENGVYRHLYELQIGLHQ